MEALKKQLKIAERKLAFYQEKKLLGGLALDQEFRLDEDIEGLKVLIENLKQQLNTSNNSNNPNEKPTVNQTHTGHGDNVGGNKVVNNYFDNGNKQESKTNKPNTQRQEVLALIDKDLDKAFDMLHDKFEDNPTYLDLVNEYISPSNNFSKAKFRGQLKAFVRVNWK
jgi:hypothetical protein